MLWTKNISYFMANKENKNPKIRLKTCSWNCHSWCNVFCWGVNEWNVVFPNDSFANGLILCRSGVIFLHLASLEFRDMMAFALNNSSKMRDLVFSQFRIQNLHFFGSSLHTTQFYAVSFYHSYDTFMCVAFFFAFFYAFRWTMNDACVFKQKISIPKQCVNFECCNTWIIEQLRCQINISNINRQLAKLPTMSRIHSGISFHVYSWQPA